MSYFKRLDIYTNIFHCVNLTPEKCNSNLNQVRDDKSLLYKATGGLFVFEYREAGGWGGGGRGRGGVEKWKCLF